MIGVVVTDTVIDFDVLVVDKLVFDGLYWLYGGEKKEKKKEKKK